MFSNTPFWNTHTVTNNRLSFVSWKLDFQKTRPKNKSGTNTQTHFTIIFTFLCLCMCTPIVTNTNITFQGLQKIWRGTKICIGKTVLYFCLCQIINEILQKLPACSKAAKIPNLPLNQSPIPSKIIPTQKIPIVSKQEFQLTKAKLTDPDSSG